MDCRKLSAEACMHAVQNERLPLRVVVQVLFFEQVRSGALSSGSNTPDVHGSIRALLPDRSHGSSRSTTTNTEDELDGIASAEDIRALKGELNALRLGSNGSSRNGNECAKTNAEKVDPSRMKSAIKSKIFSKLWSGKEKFGDSSSSETSESPASTNVDETKSTPSRSRRHSLS